MFEKQKQKFLLHRKKFNFNTTDHRISTVIVFIIATGVFCYHAHTIIDRHFQEEVNESVEGRRNSSLILPTVHMQFETTREDVNGKDEAPMILKDMKFRARLDNAEIPSWAFNISHDFYDGIHSITVNKVVMMV